MKSCIQGILALLFSAMALGGQPANRVEAIFQAVEKPGPFVISWTATHPCTEVHWKKNALLAAYGFTEDELFYTYLNPRGAVQLELYVDREGEKGCGFRYSYDGGQIAEGFAFDRVEDSRWGQEELSAFPFAAGLGDGRPIAGYEEEIAYNRFGKPVFLRSMGNDGMAFEMSFQYRPDGSLARKSYRHNPDLLRTAYQRCELFYDKKERLCYGDCYATHGSLEYYWIYQGDEAAYCLVLDRMPPYCVPVMYQCR